MTVKPTLGLTPLLLCHKNQPALFLFAQAQFLIPNLRGALLLPQASSSCCLFNCISIQHLHRSTKGLQPVVLSLRLKHRIVCLITLWVWPKNYPRIFRRTCDVLMPDISLHLSCCVVKLFCTFFLASCTEITTACLFNQDMHTQLKQSMLTQKNITKRGARQ